MFNGELSGRWSYFKNNMQHLWGKFSENDFEVARDGISTIMEKISRVRDRAVKPEDIHIDNYHYESHRMDDMPLTLNKDPGPGIKYSYTENSEFARGAEKAEYRGIDSFGEKDTFDPDEADEHQDFRNRKQNSDLGQRYFTHGLKTDNRDLHH
jgi:hypothetical protein